MKRILFAVSIVFGLSVSLHAQAPCTTGYESVDPHQGTVQAAIDAAPSGSVICLAAGSVTYTATVDPTAVGTKCTEIRGHGSFVAPWGSAAETIIYVNAPANNEAFYGRTKAGCRSMISNIRFTFDENSDQHIYSIVGFNDSGPDGTSGLPPIYHHNDFIITGQCQQPIIIDAATQGGLIYRNVFTSESIAGSGCHHGSTNIIPVRHESPQAATTWDSADTFGSADTTGLNNLYVETNYFKNFDVAADLTSGSRTVWRFNEMHNAATGGHGYDSNAVGDRHEEQYNNTYYCDDTYNVPAWIAQRGATWRIFNNIYPAFDVTKCAIESSAANAAIKFSQYRLIQCDAGNIGGWPGVFPDTYPVSHQVGWGWISGSNINVGSSTAQGIPGGAGFDQALDPIYTFANTNNTGNPLVNIASGYVGDCRAMAYSNTGKTSGTTLVIPSGSSQGNPYVNVGQEAVAVISDLVGGSAPTISDSLGNTWTAIQGGTNGSLRLTAWHSHIAHAGTMVVTFTFGSSPAARSGTVVVMRGMTATPADQNPAVATSFPSSYTVSVAGGGTGYSSSVGNCSNASATTGGSGTGLTVDIVASGGVITAASTCAVGSGYAVGNTVTVSGGGGNATLTLTDARYKGPSSGTLAQANEIVLGYFALQGPLDKTGNSTIINDAVDAVAPDLRAASCSACSGFTGLGIAGTLGSTDTTNATVAVSYRPVAATTAVQPQIADATANRTGIAGTISFKVTGSDSTSLDLQNTDFIVADQEYFVQASGVNTSCPTGSTCTPFNGTTGTGWGPRSLRPTTCTFDSMTGAGVAYWSTDQGSWNTSGGGGQGVMDLCTATNTWTNAVYVPYDYPNPLATVTGGSCTPDHLTYTDQPASALAGASLGTTAVGVYDSGNNLCADATNTITLSKNGSATYGTLSSSSSLSKAASSGVATWTDLSINTAGSGTIDAAASGLTGTTSNSITISASCTPDHLAWIAQPSNAVLGASLGTVSVGVYDISNNLCSSDSSTSITLSKDGSATWGTLVSGSSLTKTDSSGVATWTDLSVTATTGTGAIQSAASGLAGAGSVDITISAAPPAGTGGGLKLKLRLKGFVN